MIVTTHEGLQWAQNYCNEINEKFPELKEQKTPNAIKVMDLTIAYQNGAQFIQNELKKVKDKLREKQLSQSETDCTEPNLICVQNADVFAAYDEAIKMIDEIINL